jgi:hypothetical protein
MPEIRSKVIDGKKFMWDGKEYADQAEAQKAEKAYQEQNFETRVISEDGKFQVYTRRLVKEVVVQGQA